jgi:hypothetical protein
MKFNNTSSKEIERIMKSVRVMNSHGLIVNLPWYVPNSVIRRDLRIPTVKEEISGFSSHYDVRISVHPNKLIASLTEPPIIHSLFFLSCQTTDIGNVVHM